MKKLLNMVFPYFVIACVACAAGAITILQNDAQATGGGEVIKAVIPHIDVVIDAVNNNDTQKALTELEDIKTQLQDTFFEEEED